jgi:hypothetical protein
VFAHLGGRFGNAGVAFFEDTHELIKLSRHLGNGIVANARTRGSAVHEAFLDSLTNVNEPDHPLAGHWLTVKDIAAQLNVREATIRGWLSRGRFPEPDGHVGPTNVWKRETVEQWARNRPRKPT